ncbi:(ABC) transporter [Coemansia sp. RSA 1365]|nr:(ABC) transporter [Coemansia sp. RSA 1365]
MSKQILLLFLAVVLALLCNAALTDIDKQRSQEDKTALQYSNDGTEYNQMIQKKRLPQNLKTETFVSLSITGNAATIKTLDDENVHQISKPTLADSPAPPQLNVGAMQVDDIEHDYYNAFNLDGILDLMTGDDDGNVDFGAIGLELANNLANVIDMNEFGTMAATFGMMLSGLGAVNELQRQGNLADNGSQNLAAAAAANIVLNNGLAALLGQETHENNFNAGRSASMLDRSDQSQLYNMLAGVAGGGANAKQLSEIVNGIINPNMQRSEKNTESTSKNINDNIQQHHSIHSSMADSLATTIDSVMSNESARNVAGAVADLVGGNGSPNISSIAQAVGIRNFFRTEEKTIPDGCPSCFNCMYPGSVCAHNATCNKFTGRCDCPSGWTGEDCLQPGK